MRKRNWLLALLWIGIPPAWAEAPTQQALDSSLASVKASISDLESLLGTLRIQVSAEEQALALLEKAIGALEEQLREEQKAIKKKALEITALEKKVQTMQKKQRAHQQALGDQLRSMARESERDQIKQLLNQDNFAAISRLLAYYPYLHHAREEHLMHVVQELSSLASAKEQLAEEQTQLALLHEKTRTFEEKKQAEKMHRQAILSDMQRELEGQDNQLLRRYEEQYELETLLMHLHRNPLTHSPQKTFLGLKEMKGKLPLPIPRTQPLPKSPLGEGIFLPSAPGIAVRAIHPGRVVFAEWLRGFGLLTILDHGDGYISLYGHNQNLYVRPGDWADPSEIMARVGQSGGLTESGLYFEIRKDGHPLNLKKWMQRST